MQQAQLFRVALYTRVSSEEQKEGHTIDAQVAELERFAHEKNWQVVEVYKDESWSGADLSRPALNRLRDNASKGIFDAIVVNDVDRLARVAAHLWIIKRDLERQNIRVIFRKLPTEAGPTSDLMVNILASFAEFERAMILDRTRRGIRHKVEGKRMFLGCLGPYGYRYIRKDYSKRLEGFLEIVPSEAAVVRQMFTWIVAEGLSVRQVMLRLNKLGVPPARGGKKWAHSTLHRLMRNELYIGIWHYGKTAQVKRDEAEYNFNTRKWPKKTYRARPRADWVRVDLPHLQIVDAETWTRAQNELDRHRLFNPRRSKHSYLLSGLVRCGGCGASIVGQPQMHRFRYRCAAYCGKVQSIREEHLNDAVWNAIKDALLNPELINKFVSDFDEMRKQTGVAAIQAQDNLVGLASAIGEEEERIIAAYRTGKIDADTLGKQLAQLSLRRRSLTTNTADMPAQKEKRRGPSARLSPNEYVNHFSLVVKTVDFVKKRTVLREVIDHVSFDGKIAAIHGFIPLGNSASPAAAKSDSMTQDMKDQGLKVPFEISVAIARFDLA
jgi:site-specific DNA recombinase